MRPPNLPCPRPLLLTLGVALLSGLAAPAADWTRFRGPNGSGTAADSTIPVKWDSVGIAWKAPLAGVGHSSPIVLGDRVYLQSATDSARLLLCLDARTGKEVWKKEVSGKVGKTHQKNTLASSTPATDGERVYCVFWNGSGVSLAAYTLDGQAAWTQDLGSFKSQHGPGFSPVVHDGLVFVNNDQDGSAVLRAFDAKTGKPAWKADRKAFRACYSTPILHEQGAEGPEMIVVSTAGLTGYKPKTGAEVWKYTWSFSGMPLRTVGSVVLAGGMAFAVSGDGAGDRSMIAVKLGGKGDVTDTHLVWSRARNRETPYVPTPLAHQSYLYFLTDDGFAVCAEQKSGKEVWRHRLGENISGSPVLIDGKVYTVTEKGNVFVFPATPEGYKQLAKNELGESVLSSPAVANGRLFIRGSKHLFAIGAK